MAVVCLLGEQVSNRVVSSKLQVPAACRRLIAFARYLFPFLDSEGIVMMKNWTLLGADLRRVGIRLVECR